MITKSTIGWSAGIVALVLFGAACSSGSSPEVVDPTNPAVESVDSEPITESAATEESTDEAAAGQDADTTTPAVETNSETADVAEEEPPAIPAPETLQFTAPLVGGGEIDLAAEFDGKPTLFWFWAPN